MLTSGLDLDLLGHDHAALRSRARLGLEFAGLETLPREVALSDLRSETLENERAPAELPDLMEAAHLLEGDLARPACCRSSRRACAT